MTKTQKIPYALLLFGIVLCLALVWLPKWFLTGDGPCHVANARVIYDMWHGYYTDFFARFYTINTDPNPNWSTHILLAALMHMVNGIVAEKISLSILVILEGVSLYMLLHRLNKNNSLWPLVAVLFIFHQPLAKGFYNFSYSMPFFCLLLYSWLTYLERRKYRDLLLFFVFMAVTYFTHPVAFGFGCIVSFWLWVSYSASGALAGKKDAVKILLVLVLCIAPFAAMFLGFSQREGGLSEIHIQYIAARIWWLARLEYLACYLNTEMIFAGIAGITICILALLALAYRARMDRKMHKYDGFILSMISGFILFLFLPDWMLGGGLFTMRAGLLTCILACCCCAWVAMPKWLLNSGAIIIYACFVVLSCIRLPALLKCSAAVDDNLSVARFIKPQSVVLPLSFSLAGKDERHRVILEKNEPFCHVAQYLSIGKPIVVLDNYEANTNYFPLKWRPEVNPYVHLSRAQGIEGLPPAADIDEYTKHSGVNIDYVLFYYFDSIAYSDPSFFKLAQQINAQYRQVYSSPGGRTILYQHK